MLNPINPRRGIRKKWCPVCHPPRDADPDLATPQLPSPQLCSNAQVLYLTAARCRAFGSLEVAEDHSGGIVPYPDRPIFTTSCVSGAICTIEYRKVNLAETTKAQAKITKSLEDETNTLSLTRRKPNASHRSMVPFMTLELAASCGVKNAHFYVASTSNEHVTLGVQRRTSLVQKVHGHGVRLFQLKSARVK